MDKTSLDRIDWAYILKNLPGSVFVLGPSALVDEAGKCSNEIICQYHWEKWCRQIYVAQDTIKNHTTNQGRDHIAW